MVEVVAKEKSVALLKPVSEVKLEKAPPPKNVIAEETLSKPIAGPAQGPQKVTLELKQKQAPRVVKQRVMMVVQHSSEDE